MKKILFIILLLICDSNNYVNSQDIGNDTMNGYLDNIDSLYLEDKLSEAIDSIYRVMPLIIKQCGKTSKEYCALTYLSSWIFFDNGEYKRAFSTIEESLSYRGIIYGKNNYEYAIALSAKASFLNSLGMHTESLSIFYQAINIFKLTNSTNTIKYAESLKDYSIALFDIGDLNKALLLIKESKIIIESLKIPYTNYIAVNIALNYASLNSEIGNVQLAIDECKHIIKQLEDCNCNTVLYYSTLIELADDYSKIGDYHNGIKYAKMAIPHVINIVGENHPDYAQLLKYLGQNYSGLQDYSTAEKYYRDALTHYERVVGYSHPSSIKTILSLIDIYDKTNKTDELISGLISYNKRESSNMIDNFVRLDSDLQENYWEQFSYRYLHLIPSYCDRYNTDLICDVAYNSLLLSKNLLLDSEIKFVQELKHMPNKNLYDLYQDIERNKVLYNNNVLVIDSLNHIEREIRNNVIQQTDYTKSLTATWEDIKSKLTQSDIAIEFIAYKLDNGAFRYLALTLKNDYNHPRCIRLFDSTQLDKIAPRRYYSSPLLSNLIWKPLLSEIEGIEKIYFSPYGELNNIAIESLPLCDGSKGFMSDKWELYRLSSTRNIYETEDKPFVVSAALFGNMDYDAYPDMASEPSKNDECFPIIIDSLRLRDGYSSLPATKDEIDTIQSSLKQLNIDAEKFSGLHATKTNFRKMSGKSPSIMHIATHGFFYDKNDISSQLTGFASDIYESKNAITEKDRLLCRSGLLFSGANLILQDKEYPASDNGILTAFEVSKMDLYDLDLVVLSACKTGLGEIKGDGVYGLQRGFKMAGARSIMMSLWNVDDEATRMLMTEFYQNYSSGKSKQQSLLTAQRTVRTFKGKIGNIYRDFSDPRYWAAFILLNGNN